MKGNTHLVVLSFPSLVVLSNITFTDPLMFEDTVEIITVSPSSFITRDKVTNLIRVFVSQNSPLQWSAAENFPQPIAARMFYNDVQM